MQQQIKCNNVAKIVIFTHNAFNYHVQKLVAIQSTHNRASNTIMYARESELTIIFNIRYFYKFQLLSRQDLTDKKLFIIKCRSCYFPILQRQKIDII